MLGRTGRRLPTRLGVRGTVQREAVETLRSLFDSHLDSITPTSAGGRRLVEVAAVVERPDRQDDDRQAIRARMCNLVGGIVRDEPPEVTAEYGLRSLDVALRASLWAGDAGLHSGRPWTDWSCDREA